MQNQNGIQTAATPTPRLSVASSGSSSLTLQRLEEAESGGYELSLSPMGGMMSLNIKVTEQTKTNPSLALWLKRNEEAVIAILQARQPKTPPPVPEMIQIEQRFKAGAVPESDYARLWAKLQMLMGYTTSEDGQRWEILAK